jgi:hypothetical protein
MRIGAPAVKRMCCAGLLMRVAAEPTSLQGASTGSLPLSTGLVSGSAVGIACRITSNPQLPSSATRSMR